MDLNQVPSGDLRSLLRKHHPECKGSFAANAPKEVCIHILEGVYKRSDYVTSLNPDGSVNMFNLSVTALPQPAVEFEDVGVLGNVSVATPQAGPLAKRPNAMAAVGGNVAVLDELAAKLEEVDKVLVDAGMEVIGELNTGVVNIDDLKTADEHDRLLAEQIMGVLAITNPAASKRAALILERGLKKPEVHKVAPLVQPVIGTGKKVKIAGVEFDSIGSTTHVPKINQGYRFDAWSAETKVGSQKFKHDAGDVLTLLVAGERLWLGGPPGVGKTSIIEQFCARIGWGFIRVQGDKDFMKEDMLGENTATNGSIEYVYGLLAVAMKHGYVFVCDEITYFPAAVKTVLNPVLEPGGKLVLPGNGGEIIEPHPNFRIIATDNRFGHGDDTGLFPNSQVQDAALLSRWDHTFCVTWMTPNQERDLLVKVTGIEKDIAELIAKVANDTRDAADAGKLLYPLTLRHTLSWAKGAMLLKDRCGEKALALSFASACINKVPASDQVVIAEQAQRHFGDKLGKIAMAGTVNDLIAMSGLQKRKP